MQVKKERRVEPLTWLRRLSGPGAGEVLAASSVRETEQWHFTWGGESLPKPGPRRHSEYVQGAVNVNVCTLEMSHSQRNVIPGPLGLEGPLCLRFWGSDMGPVALLETLESSLCAQRGEPKAKPALVLAAGRVGSAPGREPLHLHSSGSHPRTDQNWEQPSSG